MEFRGAMVQVAISDVRLSRTIVFGFCFVHKTGEGFATLELVGFCNSFSHRRNKFLVFFFWQSYRGRKNLQEKKEHACNKKMVSLK